MSEIISEITKKYNLKIEEKDKVNSLVLDAIDFKEITPEVKTFLENFQNTKSLSMILCQLSSLKNFPDLPNLQSVDLSDNKLGGCDLGELKKYPKLTQVLLNNNNITDITKLDEFLPTDREFKHVDISENPVVKGENEKEKVAEEVFKKYPKLQYFNAHDRKGEEIPEEEDEEEEEAEGEEDLSGFVESDEEDEVDLEEGGDAEEVEREEKEREAKEKKGEALGKKVEKSEKIDSDTKASEEKEEEEYVPGKVKKTE